MLPVKRPLESSENRLDQQSGRTIQVLLLTRPRRLTRKMPDCSRPPPTH